MRLTLSWKQLVGQLLMLNPSASACNNLVEAESWRPFCAHFTTIQEIAAARCHRYYGNMLEAELSTAADCRVVRRLAQIVLSHKRDQMRHSRRQNNSAYYDCNIFWTRACGCKCRRYGSVPKLVLTRTRPALIIGLGIVKSWFEPCSDWKR